MWSTALSWWRQENELDKESRAQASTKPMFRFERNKRKVEKLASAPVNTQTERQTKDRQS